MLLRVWRTWEKLRDCEERHFAGLAPCRALLSSELFTEAQLPAPAPASEPEKTREQRCVRAE